MIDKLKIWISNFSLRGRTKIAVIAIFVILIGILAFRKATAYELQIGLGHGFGNTDVITQDFAIEYDGFYGRVVRLGDEPILPDKLWKLSAGWRGYFREGTNFQPYLYIGAAWFTEEPSSVISDRLAYDMGLGLRFYKVFDLNYEHNSTAGRTSKNRGLDVISVRVAIPFGDK